MIEIIEAQSEHAVVISELGARTFAETFVGLMYYTEEIVAGYVIDAFARKKISMELQDPSIQYFLLKADDQFVGYAKLVDKLPPSIDLKSSIYLERIYLLKSAYGKGLGGAIMQHVYTHAKKRGYKTLWLSVWEYNRRAVDFYLKAGFQKVGDWEWPFESQGKKYIDIDWIFARAIPE